MRLLVVGLDGATFDVIRPLAEQGRLPHLERLMDEGAWGVLRSTVPPISPTAWTTFATGKNPGQHGVFDFQELASDYAWQPRPAGQHRHKTIWRLLSDAGRRMVVVDVPFTYPPEAVNGIMIAGYPTPRKPDTIFTHPPDLPQQLAGQGYPLDLGWPRARMDVHPDFFRAWRDVMQDRERLLDHLMHRTEWDLFMVVFGITDTLAHNVWHYLDGAHPAARDGRAEQYREALFDGYEQCDRTLGRLWDALDDETHLIVLSDHGFGTIRPRQWLIRFLSEGGWLRFRQPRGLGRLTRSLQRAAVRAYTELGWLRRWIRELRPGAKQGLKRALAEGGLLPEAGAVDPNASLAIPNDMGTHVYLNRRSRFEHGVLSDREAEEVAQDIRRALLAVRDPIDDEPVVAAVHLRDDVYAGEAVAQAPDLVIEYRNWYTLTRNTARPNPNLEGGHVPEGILLAWGPAVEPQAAPETRLVYLAPTMLHLLGEPIPVDMDGDVLTSLLRPAWLAAHPVRRDERPAVLEDAAATTYTPEEQAEVEEQLRALGYIE